MHGEHKHFIMHITSLQTNTHTSRDFSILNALHDSALRTRSSILLAATTKLTTLINITPSSFVSHASPDNWSTLCECTPLPRLNIFQAKATEKCAYSQPPELSSFVWQGTCGCASFRSPILHLLCWHGGRKGRGWHKVYKNGGQITTKI